MFLKVLPTKGIKRFGIQGKLSSRFMGPLIILEKVRDAAYRVALPLAFPRIQNVFHISMLRKYISNTSYIVEYEPL